MIRVGEHVDVEVDSEHGPLTGRCIVLTSKRWTIEFQRIDLPFTPSEDTMIRLCTRRRHVRRHGPALGPHDVPKCFGHSTSSSCRPSTERVDNPG